MAVDTFMRGVCGPAYRAPLETAVPGAFEQAVADADTFFDQELPAVMEWSLDRDAAARIAAPALVVRGGDSEPVYRERQDLLLEWLPSAEPFVLEGATHLLQIQQPRALAGALAGFFARHETQGVPRRIGTPGPPQVETPASRRAQGRGNTDRSQSVFPNFQPRGLHMSDFTTTVQNAYRELCIQMHGAGVALRNRVEDQRGQTAAEYMGILLVVAVIIGALIAANVDGQHRRRRQLDGRQDRRRQREALARTWRQPAGPPSRTAPRNLRPGSGALLRRGSRPPVVSLMKVQIAERIRADVNSAMKAGDRDRAAALRLVLSELQKDAKEGAGDEVAVLRRERKRRRESESVYRENGREDLAETEAYEAATIETYLPAELSDAELDALVATAVAETGAEGPRDMGKAIKHVMAAAGGRVDGKRVSGKVKEALTA